MNRNTHGKMDNKKMYKKQYWTTNSRKNALKAEVSEWAALVFWENIFDAFQSMLNCNWPLLWSSILSQRQSLSVPLWTIAPDFKTEIRQRRTILLFSVGYPKDRMVGEDCCVIFSALSLFWFFPSNFVLPLSFLFS